MINCDTQEEIDYYWEKLTAGGGKEVQCGWLADNYGLSWQVTQAKFFAEWAKDPAGTAMGDARVVADDEARSRKAREGICRKVTSTCLRFMFLLCKTFQACAVATTKSDV